MSFNQCLSLFDKVGNRKYLNSLERQKFLKHVSKLDSSKKLFCLLLYYTGCRISKVLNIELRHFQFGENGYVIIRSLKKRTNISFRKIYLPPDLIIELKFFFKDHSLFNDSKVWNFCRQTGYRCVKRVMEKANITGAMSCPKGLRHNFAVNALLKGIPLPTLQKWMGHSSLEITSIYLQVMNLEEVQFAKRIW